MIRNSIFEFGLFRLNSAEQQLWRHGEEIELTPKAFKLLLLLVENSGHVLDKAQLIIWLQKATDIRHPGVTALKVEPAMDLLRSDPRFAELLRRVSL